MQPDRTSLPSPHFPSPITTHTVNGVPYADHSFEGPTNANGFVLSTNEAQVPGVNGAPLYPPGAGPWTWNGAGIAGKEAPIAFNNTTTISSPHGDFVLVLESLTVPVSVTIPFTLPASASGSPVWRFSFDAAQVLRTGAASFDRQVVKVEVRSAPSPNGSTTTSSGTRSIAGT